MRRAKKIVEFSLELSEKMRNEASSIVHSSDFSYEDAYGAIEMSVEHFIYLGETEATAWEKARDLVASAISRARENHQNLLGMVSQFLLSLHHRVHQDLRP